MSAPHPRWRRLVLTAAVLAASTVAAVLPAATGHAATSGFHGVNWADPRDNFTDDAVVPSGLSTADSYATTKAKAGRILDGFRTDLGANTVRLPVNAASVGTAWWNSYTGAIDAATERGMNVILSYWEGDSSRDGKVDNTTAFWSMWQTAVGKYAGNARVYFEPMNEPHGYSFTDWSAICATWLANHAAVPRGRVILSGTGYNQDVKQLGADGRFTGTLLSVHLYKFFSSNTTYAQFKAQLANEVGAYASRTILDEWGAPMTDGTNYHAAGSTNPFVTYLQASSDFARENAMGTVYWPGLRNGDPYSMETLVGAYPNTTLLNTNSSGRHLLLASWGVSAARTGTVKGLAGKCLDTAASGTASPKVVIATCTGGASQSWTLDGGALKSGGRCADATGGATADGTRIITYACSGAANQQWILVGNQLRNGKSGTCLDVPASNSADGTQVTIYSCNNGANQRWTLGG
ncbi:ricin-type beta-trefoil lectin domain protein [Dactylosporangium sp. CA-152071]|uniref:ricin-type beta-trefoil lectin domain protein n=1 Tax=Dactylosporangium sp. CA-152071 TaxID=3239933 RepID=UPI003D8EB486